MLTLADVAGGLKLIVPLDPGAASTPDEPATSPLGALVYRPTLYRRNDVAWASVRSWRADAKGRDLLALKRCKAALDQHLIGAAAGEIAALLQLMFGKLDG